MRGFRDIFPPLSYKFEYIRKVFEKLSFKFAVDLIELPLVEQSGLYFRTSGAGSEICKKELFEVRKYKGDFEDWVLRPEATASCMRAIKELSYLNEKKICRLGYIAPMFRYNRPQKGRYRQFYQAGWEWIGSKDKYTDLEIILGACELLSELGLDYELELNSIGDFASREKYREQLRKYFKVSEDPFKILDKLKEYKSIPEIELPGEDKATFDFVLTRLLQRGIKCAHNPYLVRGLDYYNGIVMEFKNNGQTLLAGGRYDGLSEQIGGKALPAVGFALGVDRVADILSYTKKKDTNIALISLKQDDYSYFIAEKMRDFGFSVCPLWGVDINKALKLASKGSCYAIIVGDKEKVQQTFIIKNLEKSTQKELDINCSREDLLCF